MQTTREYLEPDELAFFALPADPFEDPDDPDDCWLPAHLGRVEQALLASIRRREILALVGPPGAGKSTLLRRLWGRASREKRVRLISPATLDRRRITTSSLEVAILRDLTGQDTTGLATERRSELLRSTLVEQTQSGLYPALVIDEAHLLGSPALLAIKHLWDSHTLFRQLSVAMVGQLPLAHRLRRDPAVREVAGRTRVLELPALGETTGEYLAWRFDRVGGDAARVFDPRAFDALGLRGEHPLWINNLAVQAMRYAHELGDRVVTAEHVGRA